MSGPATRGGPTSRGGPELAERMLDRYRGMAKETEDGEIWVPTQATYTRHQMTGDREVLPAVRLADGARGVFEREVWEELPLAYPGATEEYVTWREHRNRPLRDRW